MITLLIFVAQAASHTASPIQQPPLSGFSNFVDILADKMVDRSLDAWHHKQADLEESMLGKPIFTQAPMLNWGVLSSSLGFNGPPTGPVNVGAGLSGNGGFIAPANNKTKESRTASSFLPSIFKPSVNVRTNLPEAKMEAADKAEAMEERKAEARLARYEESRSQPMPTILSAKALSQTSANVNAQLSFAALMGLLVGTGVVIAARRFHRDAWESEELSPSRSPKSLL